MCLGPREKQHFSFWLLGKHFVASSGLLHRPCYCTHLQLTSIQPFSFAYKFGIKSLYFLRKECKRLTDAGRSECMVHLTQYSKCCMFANWLATVYIQIHTHTHKLFFLSFTHSHTGICVRDEKQQ